MENVIRMIARPEGKLSDSVAAQLQHQIVSGTLKPGDRLPTEAELGAMLGVSRSVVRDAIRTLAGRGLINVRQGHGMEVAALTDAAVSHALVVLLMRSDLTMGDVLEARAAIETQLAMLAAERIDDAALDDLDRILVAFSQAVDTGDWDGADRNHTAFHTSLLSAVGLPALAVILKPMQEIIMLSSVPPRTDDLGLWEYEAHPPILDALRRRDANAVHDAMVVHFATFQKKAYSEMRRVPFRDGPHAGHLLTNLLSPDARPEASGAADEGSR